MNSLFQYLSDCNREIGEVVIDQSFIDYREEMKWKFVKKGRSEKKAAMDRDCLLPEYILLKRGFVNKSLNREYDFSVPAFEAKVDVKMYDNYFNIDNKKYVWYVMNINKGLLTHFAFYQWAEKPTKPLVVGDRVRFNLVEVSIAKNVLNNKKVSNFKGYYYTPGTTK